MNIIKSKALVPYQTTMHLLAIGLYFQAWLRIAAQVKRAMCRRGAYIVVNGKVK